MSLTTWRILARKQWVKIPITDDIIKIVENRARHEQQLAATDDIPPQLEFTDDEGTIGLYDDDSDDDEPVQKQGVDNDNDNDVPPPLVHQYDTDSDSDSNGDDDDDTSDSDSNYGPKDYDSDSDYDSSYYTTTDDSEQEEETNLVHDNDKIEATKVKEKEYLPNEKNTVVIDEEKNTTSNEESKIEDIQSDVAGIMHTIDMLYQKRSNYKKTMSLYRKNVAIYRTTLDLNHPALLTT